MTDIDFTEPVDDTVDNTGTILVNEEIIKEDDVERDSTESLIEKSKVFFKKIIKASLLIAGTFKTSTTGARVVIDGKNNRIDIFDSNGDVKMRLNESLLSFLDASEVIRILMGTATVAFFSPNGVISGQISGSGTDRMTFTVGAASEETITIDLVRDGANAALLERGAGNTISIGDSSARWENSYFNKFALTDGISAPGTEAGTAFLYVDTADGDLKVKFGDGITKTIATDT